MIESMAAAWQDGPGVFELPDGRRVRGRGLRDPMPPGDEPDFGLYLQGRKPPAMAWGARWVRWKDFWLPADRDEARAAIEDAFERCAAQRVEVACTGGRGRTGSVLACLCILAGTAPTEAVGLVRATYDRHAVETPWQRRLVRRFPDW